MGEKGLNPPQAILVLLEDAIRGEFLLQTNTIKFILPNDSQHLKLVLKPKSNFFRPDLLISVRMNWILVSDGRVL